MIDLGTLFGAVAGSLMQRLTETGAEELILWIAILAIAIAVAVYVIDKVRSGPVQHEPKATELISKFRDLHSRGELSDVEFRTIKTALATRLQAELKDNGETGCDE